MNRPPHRTIKLDEDREVHLAMSGDTLVVRGIEKRKTKAVVLIPASKAKLVASAMVAMSTMVIHGRATEEQIEALSRPRPRDPDEASPEEMAVVRMMVAGSQQGERGATQ